MFSQSFKKSLQSETLAGTNKRWQETESRGSQAFHKDIFKTLYLAYKPFLFRIILFVLIGFLGRILLLANTNLVGLWVDSLCLQQSLGNCHELPNLFKNFTPANFISTMLVFSTLGFFMTMGFRILFSRWSAQAVSTLYDETTLRTSRFPMSFFDKTPAGRIITRFSSDYGNVFRLFGGPLAEFLAIIFDLLSIIILIGVAHPIFLIFVAFAGLLNFGTYRLHRSRLRQARRELSASRSPSISHFAETAQGSMVIRAFGREFTFQNRFLTLNNFYLSQKIETTQKLILFSINMNSLSALLFLVTGLSSIWMIHQGFISVGAVGVAFSFIVMSSAAIGMFFEWLTQFEDAIIGVERLNQYLFHPIEPGTKLPPETTFQTDHLIETANEPQHNQLKTLSSTSVQLDHLWLRYGPTLPWILKDISFKVQPGEKLGIVGRTGSGKSSLIQALFYLYPFENGTISIGGLDPQKNEISIKDYRQSMAYITQDPVLFQGRLIDNLDLLSEHSLEEIYSALDKVGLLSWVESHPQKLHLTIEERGKNLSLGERQLICMARCLLQKTPIVIMDEATSSVDPQSEEIMVKATDQFFSDRTQIIIAHRLSTLEKCDRILWLDQGTIQLLGPTNEVLPQFRNSDLIH